MLEYAVFCMIFQKNNYLFFFILVKKIYESTKEIYFFFGKNFETKF